MARLTPDPLRFNHTVQQSGKEYNLRLLYRSKAVFTTLLNLLPSNYASSIEGPNYTLELKAVAVEIARLELALEDVDSDRSYSTTRSDFLYSIAGYLLLLNGQIPPTQFSDEGFRSFLLNLLQIYFKGSIPSSIAGAVSLFYTGQVKVSQNYLLVRQGTANLDISDEFGFGIDIIAPPGGGFPSDAGNAEASLRIILDIVRPAHTLYRIRYIFQDSYLPNGTVGKILDGMSMRIGSYFYDDTRKYWGGVRNRDRLGAKVNQQVSNEDHSSDF